MERLQGLNLRDGELSKPWPGPGPHLTPGAARSWTCSRCAALHLAWETAHIWGDQLASEEAQTPTNYLNKLENAAEPTPSGQCVSHMSGHCGSHVVRNYHLTGTAARCPKTELQTRTEQQRQTWSRSCSATTHSLGTAGQTTSSVSLCPEQAVLSQKEIPHPTKAYGDSHLGIAPNLWAHDTAVTFEHLYMAAYSTIALNWALI